MQIVAFFLLSDSNHRYPVSMKNTPLGVLLLSSIRTSRAGVVAAASGNPVESPSEGAEP